MASFMLIPLPLKVFSIEEISKGVSRLDVRKDKAELREGILPESFVKSSDFAGFRYAYEYEQEYPTLDGASRVRTIREIPIVLLNSGMLAIGRCSVEDKTRVLSFMEQNFVKGIVLESIDFEERVLRLVIDTCPFVTQADVEPRGPRREKIDKISIVGRGDITDQEPWERYGPEPLRRVKVQIESLTEEARVSFDKEGTVTIYNKLFSLVEQAIVLGFVVEKVIGPYLRKIGFQQKLM